MASRPRTVSYYRLDRSTVVDSAGDIAVDSFFTTSRDSLVHALRAALTRTAGYPADVLEFAWQHVLQGEAEALADYQPPVLEIAGRKAWRRLMIPAMTLTRGGLVHRIQVDHKHLIAGGRRAQREPPFSHGGDHFPNLGALAHAAFVPALRRAEGELAVCLDLEGLLATIPPLDPPVLEAPLRFQPFFESEEFSDIWSSEGPGLELGLGVAQEWDGLIPLDAWFNLEALQRICDDIGIPLDLSPQPLIARGGCQAGDRRSGR